MSRKIDNDFSVRLMKAAEHARIPYKQTALGDFLDVNKQTVDQWMSGSLPRADKMFDVAGRLGVNARWLATGDGEMLDPVVAPGLSTAEQELLQRHRATTPEWRLAIQLVSMVGTGEVKPERQTGKLVNRTRLSGADGAQTHRNAIVKTGGRK